ncbi:ABC transporter ATP-binding protein [Burkholderia sp. Tr-862]|nr:ABC transporter ATP-binding protein [Burkholderia sp. Tr-862]
MRGANGDIALNADPATRRCRSAWHAGRACRPRSDRTLCVLKYALSTWNVAIAFYPSVNILASIGICLLMMVASGAVESGVVSVE